MHRQRMPPFVIKKRGFITTLFTNLTEYFKALPTQIDNRLVYLGFLFYRLS